MAASRRNGHGEQFTKLIRNTMETDAWRALTPTAQALYPWLKLEWRGDRTNNNGKIRLSVRQAAARIGVSSNTTARAFHDLQRKGFLVVVTPARLGVGGEGKSAAYELTELAMPGTDKSCGRKLYLNWTAGREYPVAKTMANNPSGKNGKTKPCPQNEDSTVVKMKTFSKNTSSK